MLRQLLLPAVAFAIMVASPTNAQQQKVVKPPAKEPTGTLSVLETGELKSDVVHIRPGFTITLQSPTEFDKVVVGNPEVADATPKDSRTFVLQGKHEGRTTLAVLDRDGAISLTVVVRDDLPPDRQRDAGSDHAGSRVRVYYPSDPSGKTPGFEHRNFQCNPACEPQGVERRQPTAATPAPEEGGTAGQ
jgi:Flp pilus assembly secretin CpaC